MHANRAKELAKQHDHVLVTQIEFEKRRAEILTSIYAMARQGKSYEVFHSITWEPEVIEKIKHYFVKECGYKVTVDPQKYLEIRWD